MDTNTQIERLIELAIVQRTELKRLVEELPQLKEHLSAEIERTFEETEPQLRAELEEWTSKQAADKTAALGVALESKIASLAKSLEESAQAKFSAVLAARDQNADLLKQAEERIALAASEIPGKVKEIVTAELARFPRAGEIDQLRKEFQEPRGLNPRGKWLLDQTYNKLDLVTWNGDSYVSNTDGNKERPGRNAANWTLSAARGTSGGGPADLSALTAVPSNGELLIGSGTSWVNGTLSAGAGISITVGPGAITISATDGDITLDDGTAASPSLHFTNDPDTGIYRPAANTLGISVSGTQVAYFDENGLTVPSAGVVAGGSFHGANGNANNPSLSFTSDQDTGFFRHAANEIGIALGGTHYATLTSTTFSITPVVTMASSLRVNGTTDSTNKDTGAIVTEGGLGVEKSATIGGNLTVSGTGNVGGGLSVSGVSVPTILGSDYTTDATAKQLTIIARQYGSTAEPEGFMVAETYSDATNNRVDIGGGNSAYNAATKITFNTASGVSTRTGTERGYIDSTGLALSGNLTVSGAGANTVTGATTLSTPVDANGMLSLQPTGSGDYFGILFLNRSSGANAASRRWQIANNYNSNGDLCFLQSTTSTGAATSGIAMFAASGNFLLGKTIDSSNGKLQLAESTASTGGIGFGTDISLYRKSPLVFGMNGVSDLFVEATGAGLWLGSAAGVYEVGLTRVTNGIYFKTGSNTLALNLDSSQNATFAGKVGIGGAPVAASSLILRGLSITTGATQSGVDQQTTFNSDATTGGRGISSVVVTKAASFTMANGAAFYAVTPVLGSGSAITTNTGLYVANQGATGITNAYGIDIAAQSGAATTNIGLRNLGATVLSTPATAVTLADNSTMTFELTSNTSLTIKVRGTDGTTRSVALTLA